MFVLSKRVLFFVIIAAVLAGAALSVVLGGTQPAYANCLTHEGPARPDFARTTLHIEKAVGQTVSLSVEIADTPDKQAYGLMYVRSLKDECGMVFPYNPPKPVGFWMRNTFIPLDLVFFDADGVLMHIHRDAVPFDETPMHSGGATSLVLEIPAGAARRHGFQPGDRLRQGTF
ncbi:MAG: DUF192 domain-containing protein [Alphaproteobacteria bacterium]